MYGRDAICLLNREMLRAVYPGISGRITRLAAWGLALDKFPGCLEVGEPVLGKRGLRGCRTHRKTICRAARPRCRFGISEHIAKEKQGEGLCFSFVADFLLI